MIELLLIVIVCGIVAWIIQATPMQDLFKKIAYGILAIIVIVAFFQIVFHVGLNLPLR